jgi:hypothetical protein
MVLSGGGGEMGSLFLGIWSSGGSITISGSVFSTGSRGIGVQGSGGNIAILGGNLYAAITASYGMYLIQNCSVQITGGSLNFGSNTTYNLFLAVLSSFLGYSSINGAIAINVTRATLSADGCWLN